MLIMLANHRHFLISHWTIPTNGNLTRRRYSSTSELSLVVGLLAFSLQMNRSGVIESDPRPPSLGCLGPLVLFRTECACRVHIWPAKPYNRGNRSRIRLKRTKQLRCETALRIPACHQQTSRSHHIHVCKVQCIHPFILPPSWHEPDN